MYRLIGAAAAAAVLLAAAGCGGDARPAAAPTPVLSASAQAACRDALVTQRVRWEAFEGRWAEVLTALARGDENGSAAAGEIASQELFEWARELGLLKERTAGDPALSGALDSTITALNGLGAPEDRTPADRMRAAVSEAARPVAAACGATPPPVT
ncbi:hypothetical protein GCM10010123_00170 [Pilimelia anulata]|uniref:Lipoprotein n=1 Tax=Pilimelia anulata TaxID=53371 RepID=A0A8J3F788_9ACTN|nr:hypothetical protein GCM10010123_00170 [Pilimelia anulata]